MNFGQALETLKAGKRVARTGWDGKGMWLALVRSENRTRTTLRLLPWIGMKTADGCFVPWLASQTDLLAEDWGLVGELGASATFPVCSTPASTPAMFPVWRGTTSVPWAKVETLREKIERSTSQTLEALAARGGLTPLELWYAATGNGPYSPSATDFRAINEWLTRWAQS